LQGTLNGNYKLITTRYSLSIGGVWTADGTVFNSNPALEWEEDMRVAVGDCRLLEATVVGREAGTESALLRVAAKQYPCRRYPSRKYRV
jgi:hypothetical protein